MQSFTGLDSIATLRVALRMLSCASTCSRTRGAALAAAWQRLVHGIGIFAPWRAQTRHAAVAWAVRRALSDPAPVDYRAS